jgi:hypothetical protein
MIGEPAELVGDRSEFERFEGPPRRLVKGPKEEIERERVAEERRKAQ